MFAITTGITGKVGGTVARTLLAAGKNVRAKVVRDAREGEACRQGCEVVSADMNDERTRYGKPSPQRRRRVGIATAELRSRASFPGGARDSARVAQYRLGDGPAGTCRQYLDSRRRRRRKENLLKRHGIHEQTLGEVLGADHFPAAGLVPWRTLPGTCRRRVIRASLESFLQPAGAPHSDGSPRRTSAGSPRNCCRRKATAGIASWSWKARTTRVTQRRCRLIGTLARTKCERAERAARNVGDAVPRAGNALSAAADPDVGWIQ